MIATRIFNHVPLKGQLNSMLYQSIAKYASMRDKLPTFNPDPFELNDEPIRELKTSKAMRAYQQRTKEYNESMAGRINAFNIGKRHLANMMGQDPETFTQNDIDEAIEYLFPSGLVVDKAKPVMKPPEEIYPPQKAAQFDESGRPYHFLFYTLRPNFYQILHDAVILLKDLNKYEDRVLSGEIRDPEIKPVDVSGTQWLPIEMLQEMCIEKLSDQLYSNYVNVMNRLLDHEYSYKVADFILKHRVIVGKKVEEFIQTTPLIAEDGRQFAVHKDIVRKTAIADVTVYYPGSGNININGKDIRYFDNITAREQVLFPLIFTNMIGKVDIEGSVHSGGDTSQAGAIRLGISKGLMNFVEPDMIERMRLAGLLDVDVRKRERKKPGRVKARKSPTWKKR